MNNMTRDVLKYLNNINVDTRFISLMDKIVYINNLRFSKFSKRKEEVFLNKYPDFKVVRSKIFQKICSRASKVLVKNIKPHENIFILNKSTCLDYAVLTVLEPYQRKYGIKLFVEDSFDKIDNQKIDATASNLTLDDEVETILNRILNGKEVDLLSSKDYYDSNEGNKIKIIYPLLNVPRKWIYSWLDLEKNELTSMDDDLAKSLLDFLEKNVPDVRENIYKSTVFISKNKVKK